MSAIDSLIAQLDQPDHTHVWSHDDVLNARAELSALREEIHTRGVTIDHLSAENARMREALEYVSQALLSIRENGVFQYLPEDDGIATGAIETARAALGGRDDD